MHKEASPKPFELPKLSTNCDEETTMSDQNINSVPTFMEDTKQIGVIFDRELFTVINSVDHIQKTEQELENMKLVIKDKKRLQKERNVLTA